MASPGPVPGRHPEAGSSTDGAAEYQVKAALLQKFIHYTTWPESSFEDENSPFVILIVGDDPFGSVLEKTLEGHKGKGRDFAIRRSKAIPEQLVAHLVFSRTTDKVEKQKLIELTAKRPVLLLGDAPGFATSGALMNFAIEKARVRFEINQGALAESPLTISSELLKLARIVTTEKDLAHSLAPEVRRP